MVTFSVDRKNEHEMGQAEKPDPKIESVKLADLDRSLQTRVKLDEAAIEDYTAIVENGGELDAGIAYRLPDGRLALVAGFHRAEAYRRAGTDSMSVEIREGAEFWAIRAGVADNNRHMGVRFTSADRRKVVEMLLGKFPQYGDGLVASTAGVDRSTVVRHRRRLEEAGTCSNATSRIGADGREIAVGKIGKTKVAKHEDTLLTEASSSLGSQDHDEPPTPESGCTPAAVAAEMSDSIGIEMATAHTEVPQIEPAATQEAEVHEIQIPGDLQTRLDGLTPEEKSDWRKHFQERLDQGIPEEAAGWRALADVRAERGWQVASDETDGSVLRPEPEHDTDHELEVLRGVEANLVEALAGIRGLHICKTARVEHFVTQARSELRTCRTQLGHAG